MKRKLVRQGAATMMISLPAKWVKANNLDKGDEVDLSEEGNSLVIGLGGRAVNSKKVIDISGLSPLVNRALISLYIKGVDELEVRFSDPKEIKDFQKRVINELIGFEIIRQSNNVLYLKDITGTESQDIDDLIRRIFFVIDSMVDEFIIALNEKQDLQPIMDIDVSVNKFVNFCLRILNKSGYKNSNKTPQIYGIISSLEEISDVYKSVAREIMGGKKMNNEQKNILIDTKESLNLFKELLFKFDKEKVVSFANRYESIKKKIKNKDIIDFYLMDINNSIIRMNDELLAVSLL